MSRVETREGEKMGNSVSENRRTKVDIRLFARSRNDSNGSHAAAGSIAAGGWRGLIPIAMLAVVIQVAGVRAAEAPVAKMAVSASPAAAQFGETLVEGVMDFQGKRYLLILQGVSGGASSVGSVFGLQRMREIVGSYKPAADGWRNGFGVTIRFEPPLSSRSGTLRINLASQIYPKVSTGQGGYSQ